MCCTGSAGLLQNNSNVLVVSAKARSHNRHALHLRSQVSVLLENFAEWRLLVSRAGVWARIQTLCISNNVFHLARQRVDVRYDPS